jgi:hypothetical protein
VQGLDDIGVRGTVRFGAAASYLLAKLDEKHPHESLF